MCRGATHCEVSLFEANGTDKLEAKNMFADLAARDEYVNKLSPPNHSALAEMGISISTQMGVIVSNSLTASASTSAPPPQSSVLPSSSVVAQPNKSSWPELKNTPAATAVGIITGHRPDVKAMLVPQVSAE
jgi:hypothetical protein